MTNRNISIHSNLGKNIEHGNDDYDDYNVKYNINDDIHNQIVKLNYISLEQNVIPKKRLIRSEILQLQRV